MRGLVIWLTWLAGLLAFAVALEIGERPAQFPIGAVKPVGFMVADTHFALAPIDTDVWHATILARPLFRPDRKPIAVAPQASTAMPRLTAIVRTASGATAIFAGDDGKAIIVAIGGNVDGFQVLTINPNNVLLTGPSGRMVLHPVFAPAPDLTNAGNPGFVMMPPRNFLDNQ